MPSRPNGNGADMPRLRIALTAAAMVVLAVAGAAGPAAASTARPAAAHAHHGTLLHSHANQGRMHPANMPTEGS
jgi:hypothetical protein